ncbi:hypothetical protein [Actinomadura sp. 3N508]|uniref:hypothetical protein n=1 Tax=Actinomadura sp. 3N508 TaxID=3375153 RepID=UPI0037AD3043
MATQEALTPEYVAALATAFADAVASTSPDEPFPDRARAALDRLPDRVVQQLGDAAAALVTLTRERLNPPAPGKIRLEFLPDPPHVADAVRRARRGY